MLHKWVAEAGAMATGNVLERALDGIGRRDIVNSCIHDVQQVTDDAEIHAARIQLTGSCTHARGILYCIDTRACQPEAFFQDPVVSQQCLNIDKQQLLTTDT